MESDNDSYDQPRRWFTLTDLLILLALIVVVLGLFFPQVHRARDRGNHARCQNNARQIVLAAITAAEQHKRLPPAFGTYANKTGALFFHLLPYLEERGVYEDVQGASTFDFTKGIGLSPNAGASKIPVFICPSDCSGPIQGQDGGWGTTNYGGNWLVFSPGTNYQINDRTAQVPGSSRIPEGFKDGVSNTIFFSEKFAVCGSSGGNRWAYPPSVTFNSVVPSDNYGGFFNFTAFSVANPFGWYLEKYQEAADQRTCKSNLAQSPHTGGTIVVAMGDGSVRSVSGLTTGEDVQAADPDKRAQALLAVQLGSTSLSWRAALTPNGLGVKDGVIGPGHRDQVAEDWD